MPVFEYVAKDQRGKTYRGRLEVASQAVLIDQLRRKDLIIVSLAEAAVKTSGGGVGSRKKVKGSDLVIFSRQLATMVESGIPLVQALHVLSNQVQNPNLKQVTVKIASDVESGSTFSEGLARHPRTFSDLFVNMVKAGESSGKLDEILDRISGYLEKADALRRKVKSALIYPILVTVVAISITTGLLVFVVPKFKSIFESLGGQLPLPTRILLGFSDALRNHFVLLVIGLIVLIASLRWYAGTPGGRAWMDATSLKLPVFGPLLQKVAVARFARTLATLVRSGVSILTSLDIVGKTAGNVVVERAAKDVRSRIREGESIAEPLAASKVFPPMVVHMIAVGEKTGELEKMLSKVADFYESEVDAAVAGLTSIIEPLIIVFLGTVIGGIVVALFMPILKMTSLVK